MNELSEKELQLMLAKNLCTIREEKHLSQKELAAQLHISRQAYSNYETGRRSPSLYILLVLSDFYLITLEQLIFHQKSDR